MNHSADTTPNIVFFDETHNKYYGHEIEAATRAMGGRALSAASLQETLDLMDLDTTAAITTANVHDLRTDKLPTLVTARPFIERAHELEIPLALLSQHPGIELFARKQNGDAVIDSSYEELETLNKRLQSWLLLLEFRETELETPQSMLFHPEVPLSQIVGPNLFGSETKLLLGIWIASREQSDGDFYQTQIAEELGINMSGTMKSALDSFCELGMVIRKNPKNDRRVFYRKLDSPFWSVFEATAIAIQQTRPSSE